MDTTVWQAEHISKLPFWNKGSRNQESSRAFAARGRDEQPMQLPPPFQTRYWTPVPCWLQQPGAQPSHPCPRAGRRNSRLSSSPGDDASPGCRYSEPGWLLTPGHTALPCLSGFRLPCSALQVPPQKISNLFYLATSCLPPLFKCICQDICQRVEVPKPARSRPRLGSDNEASIHSLCRLTLCHLQPFCKNNWPCHF